MFFHATCMLLICLFLPFVADMMVDPIVHDLFGNSTNVLSMNVLATMALMLVAILFIPLIMWFISKNAKRAHRKIVLLYMGGANEGDNRNFTNSFGEKERMSLSNWYMSFERLFNPSIIIATVGLIAVFCIVIGGAVL